MNEWNIQSRAHHCQVCAEAFLEKQVYHTLLFDEKEGYLRRDICEACWQREYQNQARAKGFVSYWQGIYEPPQLPLPEPIEKETAETLLRKLIEIQNPNHAAAGYILAVMLERKRLLKIKEQFHRDGQRIFVYEHAGSGDLFTIADPSLLLRQLEDVQRTVAALLEFGLTPEGEIAWPSEPAQAQEALSAELPGSDPDAPPTAAKADPLPAPS
jgi:hypothetical protein